MKRLLFFSLSLLFIHYPSSLALNGVCYAIGRDPRSPSPYNYQEKYWVACDCDCSHTLGKCHKCDHHHDRENHVIINQQELTEKSHSSVKIPPTTQHMMTYLTNEIKRQKQGSFVTLSSS